MNLAPETKKHFVQSLTSKKFITAMYSLTWLFIILLVVILANPSETIINALLMAIASVYAAYVTGNTVADHYGKTPQPKVEDAPTISSEPGEQK